MLISVTAPEIGVTDMFYSILSLALATCLMASEVETKGDPVLSRVLGGKGALLQPRMLRADQINGRVFKPGARLYRCAAVHGRSSLESVKAEGWCEPGYRLLYRLEDRNTLALI